MARFFFHLASERGLIEDDVGLDLPDHAAARQAAIEAARDLAAQAVRRGEDLARPIVPAGPEIKREPEPPVISAG